jgi:hypothetical protein
LDKPAPELNVNEIKKLDLELKKQIAHPDPPEQELNLKEHSELGSYRIGTLLKQQKEPWARSRQQSVKAAEDRVFGPDKAPARSRVRKKYLGWRVFFF